MKIVLDIETIQPTKEDWAALKGIDLSGFKEDKLFQELEENRLEKDYERASFDGTFSRIVCIGAIFLKDDLTPLEAVAWYGPNEKEILQQFWKRIGSDRPRVYITYNGLGFDLPFIKKRSVINRIKPSVEISLARFRTEPVYDAMAIWANWDMRATIKLDVLARALGLETKSGSGSEVAGTWAADQQKEIAEYCLQDVYVTYAVYCRMNYKDPLPSEEVLSHKTLSPL